MGHGKTTHRCRMNKLSRMRVASPSSPKEKITMHHQITVITQTKAASQMSMEDSKTEQQSDNEKEPEMASGDFLRYRGSRKKLQDEDKEDLGHYEEEEYGHDFVQLPGSLQHIPVWEYFGAEWDARIV
jgi:hypothetical protein